MTSQDIADTSFDSRITLTNFHRPLYGTLSHRLDHFANQKRHSIKHNINSISKLDLTQSAFPRALPTEVAAPR